MTPRLRTQRSFETLYHAHVTDVYRYALAVTGQTSDAEDVTQTTFMNAYRAYARGERPRKPQNWLLTIAHNVCRQRARLGYYRVREVEFEENAAEAFQPPDDIPTAADIRRAIAYLPFQQRAVLIMRELEGRTHAEIAEVLGLTTQATEMLAFRARRALREHLAESLTCTQATTAIDRQTAGTLDAESAGLLRAHLRECAECEQLARRMRAQQAALKSFVVVPLPTALSTFNSGAIVASGSAGLGAGIAAKVAAVTVAAVTMGGGAYLVKHGAPPLRKPTTPIQTAQKQRHSTVRRPASVAVAGTWHGRSALQTAEAAAAAAGPSYVHSPGPQPGAAETIAPIVTAPAPPTDTETTPPPLQTDTQPVQPDQPATVDQSPQSAQSAQVQNEDSQPGSGQQGDDNGVRAHGTPVPPADPQGSPPGGKSQATPPPYFNHK